VQILVLLIAAVLCNHVMGRPQKTKDDCSFTRQKPSVGILRIRYFLFGDDFISQEELELSDLFDREPTAGRDKVPPSGTNEQMRPTDQKENQPTTKPPVPIPKQPEGQQVNPQNPEQLPGNPPMVDPSKTGVPLPDESINQLEQQKIQNPDTFTNPNPPGQSTQMREPIAEDKDRNQEPLEQLNAPNILQQPKSQQTQQQPQQQTQQQPFQPEQQPQQPQQEFQPQFQQQPQQQDQRQQQPRQEFQQLQQQLQQDQPQQPQQQQSRATERRKRWQPPFRQVPSDYDDSYPRYGTDFLYPRAKELFRQAETQRFFDGTRPATNTNTDLHILDDRSGYLRPRNDGGGVDIDLNV
jgi:hypothetical protein